MVRFSKYTPEFEEQCVQTALESNGTIGSVARDLGIPPELLARWLRRHGEVDRERTREEIAAGAAQAIEVAIGHYTHDSDMRTSGNQRTWKENYATQKIKLPRPERGLQTVSVRCPVCDDPLTVVLSGSDAIRQRRVILALCGLACLGIGASYVATDGWGIKDPGLLVFAPLVLLCVGLGALFAAFQSEASLAVGLASGSTQRVGGRDLHKLFGPKIVVASGSKLAGDSNGDGTVG